MSHLGADGSPPHSRPGGSPAGSGRFDGALAGWGHGDVAEPSPADAARSRLLRVAAGDAEAVRRLGIPRKTFYDKLHRHGIDIAAFRKLEPDGIS